MLRDILTAYSDPHVPIFPKMRRYKFDLKSIELTSSSIANYDCVLVATDHKAFDYELIKQHANLIVDSRGVYRDSFDGLVKA